MGGNGSGKWHRLNTKTITDRCLSMDINEISKYSKLRHGYEGTITWTSSMGKETKVDIRIEQQSIELDYVVNSRNDQGNINYAIQLTFTSCNYGSRRPWFSCPVCGKRVAKLYLNGKYFLCRHCHNLAYVSQSEELLHRLMRKAKKIREKLDCTRDLSEPILFKPRGMHQRTFDRLIEQSMLIERRLYGVMRQDFDRW